MPKKGKTTYLARTAARRPATGKLRERVMSSIGSGYGALPGVNPYAGSTRGTSDTDGARVNAVDRALDSDHEQFSDNLTEPSQPEHTGDRDADGQSSARAARRQDDTTPDGDSSAGASTIGVAPKSPVDDHRGNLIDFEA